MSTIILTSKDNELLGASNSTDGMGILAVWSERGRDLVPHLTEQTSQIRGFQILIEAFRLWEIYEPQHPQHAGHLDDFFLLIEQAFARTIGWHQRQADWTLPGARRVRARAFETPHISLKDTSWHLLDSQKATGLWGLYRGASQRGGLLTEGMTRLSPETLSQADGCSLITGVAQKRLFEIVSKAMDGQTVEFPTHMNNELPKALFDTYITVPLAQHLKSQLIDAHELNKKLARMLPSNGEIDHRKILTKAARELTSHTAIIQNTIRCENLISVIEAVFMFLCYSKGKSVPDAVAGLDIDLESVETARMHFGTSGEYKGNTASIRKTRFFELIDTTSVEALSRSVLLLHQKVSKDRGRAVWAWEENGLIQSDLDLDNPPEPQEFQVGVAWRNDYYLYPLREISRQLTEVL